MKAKGYQIDALKNAIQNDYRGAFIFGYDDSMVDEYAKKIIGLVLGAEKNDFNLVELSGAHIKESPGVIGDEMNALSLMGGRRLVWVKGVTEAMAEKIEEAVESAKSDAFLLLTGGAFPTKSGLRLWCEGHDKMLGVVCYADEAQDVRGVITSALAAGGYRIEPEALALLQSLLGQSRGMTRSELEKLMVYQGDDKLVTAETVAKVVDDSGTFSVESLFIAIMDGDQKRADGFFNALLGAGETPVAFVRLLLIYFNKMMIAIDVLHQKKSMEEALKKILTPAQFKLKAPMTRYLSTWDKKNLADVLNLLMETEKNIKSGTMPPELIIGRAIMGITSRAQRLRR